MSKGGREIEAEVRTLLRACSLAARGLWGEMRHVIDEESSRPGHLQIGGRPINQPQLANIAGCPCETVAPLLQELEDAGLLSRTAGAYHAPMLARLAEVRARATNRVKRCRGRKAVGGELINPPSNEGGVNYTHSNTQINAPVTPNSPPPSPSPASPPALSPPHTPSLTHPLPPPPTSPPTPVPPTTAGGVTPDEEIYRAYPRHVGKEDAIKAINKARRRVAQRGELDPHSFLLAKVTTYATKRRKACAADPDESKFTPYPASWFNDGRYDDDEAAWDVSPRPINGRRPTPAELGEYVSSIPTRKRSLETEAIHG